MKLSDIALLSLIFVEYSFAIARTERDMMIDEQSRYNYNNTAANNACK